MEDRVPNEAREEPSEPADSLESGRRTIRKVGLIGFAIIDNAAHLGGLIGGAICGAVMIKKDGQAMPVEVGAAVKALGIASLLAIAVISLLSILKIFHI